MGPSHVNDETAPYLATKTSDPGSRDGALCLPLGKPFRHRGRNLADQIELRIIAISIQGIRLELGCSVASGNFESRQLRTSLVWRFGSNTVKAARQRKDASEEEKKRTQGSGGLGQ